jgi:cysteine synthase
MAYYLLRHEGIYVGPSAALNVVGAVKMARELGMWRTFLSLHTLGLSQFLQAQATRLPLCCVILGIVTCLRSSTLNGKVIIPVVDSFV